MIAIRLQGRLGNQLFQYAFVLAISKELNTNFYIDQLIERSMVDKYFKNETSIIRKAVGQLFNIQGFKNIFSFYLRIKYYQCLSQLYNLPVKSYNYNCSKAEITLQNNTMYAGFFQSVSFFKNFEGLIRNKFSVKKKYIDQFKYKYNTLYQNNHIVTVHIRRTDYQNLSHLNLGGDDLSLPITYYKNAIARHDKQNVHFMFISDDFDFVNENFKELNNKTISTDTEIMDFQHLLNADKCIISNSTFSWWGAWLNNKPDKIIYAPKYFLGWRIKKQIPVDIYPENWIQIDF